MTKVTESGNHKSKRVKFCIEGFFYIRQNADLEESKNALEIYLESTKVFQKDKAFIDPDKSPIYTSINVKDY